MTANPNTYDRFRRMVRRYAREPLLELVAKTSIDLYERDGPAYSPQGGVLPVLPFSLAAIAKEAVLMPWERSKVANGRDLLRMADLYMGAGDAFAFGQPGSLERFMVQTAYEQFSWQLAYYPELARAHALYVQAAADYGSETITDDFWTQALGCSLSDYVGAASLWWTAAHKNAGYVDPGWLDQVNFIEILEHIDRTTLLGTLEQLTGTYDDIRELSRQTRPADRKLQRFEVNPLEERPIVTLDDGRLLAPQPLYILRKATATGLFYSGIKVGGQKFATELGHIFEHYVGMQLRHIPNLQIYDEFLYGPDDERARTVDYFIDTGDTLVLVEVKSTRLSADARAAGPRLSDDLVRSLGKAFSQIRRDANHIRDGHPEFAHLPRRDHLAGMVVTLEPYHMAHTEDVRAFTGEDPSVPTIVASSGELEDLVRVGLVNDVRESLDEMFRRGLDEQRLHPRLHVELKDLEYGDNPIFVRAWEAYPWG